MDIGAAFEGVDVRSYVIRSTNQGRNWSAPVAIPELPDAAFPQSMTCRIGRVSENELVGLACYFDRSQRDFGLTNPGTEGFVPTHFALVRSADGGQSWSAPEPIKLGLDWPSFETCSPILALAPDRWLLPTSIWPNWEGDCPLGMRAVAFASCDQGRSWGEVVNVIDQWQEEITAWEQKMIVLSDGRVLALAWSFDYRQRKSLNNVYAFSSDEGAHFGPAQPTPLQGETCTPIALPDNHLLCVYRRTDRPGLWAQVARIEGDRWVVVEDLLLWSGERIYGELSESVMKQLGSLRFGCPTVAHIEANEYAVAFWCTENCVSNIRWFRLKVAL